jgi:hypothetical protein
MNESRVPYWFLLYRDFISETEPYKLRARLETLEGAMFSRLRELNGSEDGNAERLAIEMAAYKLLEIKVSKLGFSPVRDPMEQPSAG